MPFVHLPEGSQASDPKQNMFLNNGNLDRQQLLKVQKLLPIDKQEGLSLSQLALAWCLRNRELSSVIIGASKPTQIQENIGVPQLISFEDEGRAIGSF